MTQAIARQHTLEDVLYQFALDYPRPDADALERYTRANPQFAAELTDHAVALLLEPELSSDQGGTDQTDEDDAALLGAMSRFHNALFAKNEATAPTPAPTIETGVHNPFRDLGRAEIRQVAAALDVNSVFLMKLRDRRIQLETMTSGFLASLSRALKAELVVVRAYLGLEPALAPGRSYKADAKPVASAKETFADAVRSSGLSMEQQTKLLEL